MAERDNQCSIFDTKKLSPKKMKEKKICQPAKIAKLIKVKRRKLEAAGV